MQLIKDVNIGERKIGDGHPVFIIAEAGVNHNGDMNLAHRLIDQAAAAGADAVKFQGFVTEEVMLLDVPKANYQVVTTGKLDSQYNMVKPLELSGDQQMELKAHCDRTGILYLCTPYDNTSIDLLDRMGVAAFKVASTDTTNIPFLRYMAGKGRPVLLSTGMSTLGEVELAIETLRDGGLNEKIILLHCISEYPAPVNEVNLRAMQTMRQAFGVPMGFSDHTPGIGASPWAVALGACVIEKHFTLDRTLPGPDHQSSLVSSELVELIKTIRLVESALGDGIKRIMPSELPNKPLMQKSLVAKRTISVGQLIRAEDLTCKRPGTGLSPIWFDRVIGKRASRFIPLDHLIGFMDIDWTDT